MNKIIDHNEEKVFHPSLDIKDNTLIVGFRIKNEDGKESNLYLASSNGKILLSGNFDFAIDDKKITIEKKKRLLSKLSQKWSMEKLNTFIDVASDPIKRPVNEKALYDKIKAELQRHIELEDASDYSILTSWMIGTYFFPAFSAYPYIHIKAPKGSGKSQCLNLLCQTAFNAVKARASLPALRDTVDALRGTYLMDQADALHRNNQEDLLDILTDSYKRGGGSVRKMVAVKNAWNLEEFEAYSPKGFASINQLPEDLRDRCIVIPLVRSNKNYPAIDEESPIWKEIRGDLYMFLATQFQFVCQSYFFKKAEYKINNEIFGRQLELWLPIETLMMVCMAPQEEIDLSKKRFLSRYEFASYQASEIEVAVIEVIMRLMGDKDEMVLRPKEIAPEMDAEHFEEDDDFKFASKKTQSIKVGRAITKFNLATRKLARDSEGEKYLFTKIQLKKVYDGYFNKKSEEQTTQTYTEENKPQDEIPF